MMNDNLILPHDFGDGASLCIEGDAFALSISVGFPPQGALPSRGFSFQIPMMPGSYLQLGEWALAMQEEIDRKHVRHYFPTAESVSDWSCDSCTEHSFAIRAEGQTRAGKKKIVWLAVEAKTEAQAWNDAANNGVAREVAKAQK